MSVDVAYVGNRLVGGLPPAEGQTININAVQRLGGGDTDRPYFASHRRQLDIEIYSPYRKTSYHALQVGVTRPFTDRLLIKGHYTFSRSKAPRQSLSLMIRDKRRRATPKVLIAERLGILWELGVGGWEL